MTKRPGVEVVAGSPGAVAAKRVGRAMQSVEFATHQDGTLPAAGGRFSGTAPGFLIFLSGPPENSAPAAPERHELNRHGFGASIWAETRIHRRPYTFAQTNPVPLIFRLHLGGGPYVEE